MDNTKNAAAKSGFVTLIGRPNVGKSTLMNHLIGQKIAITSKKPQTTRRRIRTVYTDERGQIVFTDTPGVNKAKNKLGEYMLTAAEGALGNADAALWLVEPGEQVNDTEEHIAKLLSDAKLPVILVVNKTDENTKEAIAEVRERYEALMKFTCVVEVSALRSVHTKELVDRIFDLLKEGPMFYDEDTITDQPVRQIAAEIIREKALRCLGDEVPHGIAVVIDRMHTRPDGSVTDVDAEIICERESHKGIIIGKKGSMLKKIGSQARADIEDLIGGKINLQTHVKVRKDWRDSDILMKNYGYDKKELKQ